MKNLYSALLLSMSVLLAGSLSAQSAHTKPNASVRGAKLTNPILATHPAASNAERGGGTPSNDGCGSTSTVELPIGGSITFTGDNTGATSDGDYVAGDGLETFGPVVWHKFSVSGCAVITAAYCGTTPAFENLAAFLARTCPATEADYVTYTGGDFTSCGDGNGTITWANVPAGTYYFPVLMSEDATNGLAVGPYTIALSATACPTPPGNDECGGSILLSASGTVCNPTNATTAAATEDLGPIECNGYTSTNANDVWFSFVAVATTQTIAVAAVEEFDAVVELFSGSCGSLTAIVCEDATYPSTETPPPVHEQLIYTSYTVGNTYYFRVYDYAHGSALHNFSACVVEGSGTNVAVEEIAASNTNWSIFPNPGNGQFNLQYAGANGVATIEVFDLTGRAVYSEQAQLTTGATRTMDLTNLAQGNYRVRLTASGTRTEQALVVK